jgi:hypothetical protein
VSAKVAGETASLTNPALDRILDFAGEVGLVVLLHNDVDMPFPRPNQDPYPAAQLAELLKRHPRTTVIWAHGGLGRIVHPLKDHIGILERGLSNPALPNLYLDISWDEVAKYLVATPETTQAAADLINRHPDRFLFGTDEVAPTEQAKYLKVYDMYAPLFAKLTPEASEKLRHKANYERPLRRGPSQGTGLGEGANPSVTRGIGRDPSTLLPVRLRPGGSSSGSRSPLHVHVRPPGSCRPGRRTCLLVHVVDDTVGAAVGGHRCRWCNPALPQSVARVRYAGQPFDSSCSFSHCMLRQRPVVCRAGTGRGRALAPFPPLQVWTA